MVMVFIACQVGKNSSYVEDYCDAESGQKEKKVVMVPCADTVIYPRTVMVKPLNALVTNAAMARSFCSDSLTVRTQHDRINGF
jgi:hypothetical protein